jgi:hypothetical protein
VRNAAQRCLELSGDGSIRVTKFHPVHLRPHETVELPPVVLLLPSGEPVTATWEASPPARTGFFAGC